MPSRFQRVGKELVGVKMKPCVSRRKQSTTPTKHGYILEGKVAPSLQGLVDYILSSGSAILSSSGVSNLRASDEEAKVLKAMSSNLTKQDDIALALCSLKWANLEQTESEVALETWKSQRRRVLLQLLLNYNFGERGNPGGVGISKEIQEET